MDKIFYYKVNEYSDARLAQAIEEIFANSKSALRLNEKSKVLIKPNLLAKHAPAAAVTTHPEVVRQIVLALLRRGVKNIIIADSPGGVYKPELMRSIYDVSGLAAVCAQTGAQLYTDCKFAEKTSQGKLCHNWSFIMPIHECDFIINAPKLKTHMMMNLSCGIKNLFGCIPGLQKAELHLRFPEKALFGEMLCDLYEAVLPDITIADGILSMEGNGPAGGNARQSGVLLASDNAAALDLAACKLIGLLPQEVPYLATAIDRGLCPHTLTSSMLVGDELKPIMNYKLPAGNAEVNFSSKVPKVFSKLLIKAQGVLAPHPKIAVDKCIGCGKCAEICPARVINIANNKAKIDTKRCIRCFCCHEVCPVRAIQVKRISVFKL